MTPSPAATANAAPIQTLLSQYGSLLAQDAVLHLFFDGEGNLLHAAGPILATRAVAPLLQRKHTLEGLLPGAGHLACCANACSIRTRSAPSPLLNRSLGKLVQNHIPMQWDLTLRPIFQGSQMADFFEVCIPINPEVSDGIHPREPENIPALLVEPNSGLILDCHPGFASLLGMDSETLHQCRMQEIGLKELLLHSTLQADRPGLFPVSIHPARQQRHWAHSRNVMIGERALIKTWILNPIYPDNGKMTPADPLADALQTAWPDRPQKVLICDDNELLTDTCQALLDWIGIGHHTAFNGKDALHLLEHHPFDVLLLDLNMPMLNGFDTVRMIRQSGRSYAKMPIVAMSATPFDAADMKPQLKHFDAVLQKPFDIDDLRLALQQAMKHQRQPQDTQVIESPPPTDPANPENSPEFTPTPFMIRFHHRQELMQSLWEKMKSSLETALEQCRCQQVEPKQSAVIELIQHTRSMATSMGATRLEARCFTLENQFLSDNPPLLTDSLKALELWLVESLAFFKSMQWTASFSIGSQCQNPVVAA
jgi:CheY-like chemotaxis protein/HPt (histidine-containing phosphotransfer) domain-containing protein